MKGGVNFDFFKDYWSLKSSHGSLWEKACAQPYI